MKLVAPAAAAALAVALSASAEASRVVSKAFQSEHALREFDHLPEEIAWGALSLQSEAPKDEDTGDAKEQKESKKEEKEGKKEEKEGKKEEKEGKKEESKKEDKEGKKEEKDEKKDGEKEEKEGKKEKEQDKKEDKKESKNDEKKGEKEESGHGKKEKESGHGKKEEKDEDGKKSHEKGGKKGEKDEEGKKSHEKESKKDEKDSSHGKKDEKEGGHSKKDGEKKQRDHGEKDEEKHSQHGKKGDKEDNRHGKKSGKKDEGEDEGHANKHGKGEKAWRTHGEEDGEETRHRFHDRRGKHIRSHCGHGCGGGKEVDGEDVDKSNNGTLQFANTLQQDTESFIADLRDWVKSFVGEVEGSTLVVDTTFTLSTSGRVDTRRPCGDLVAHDAFPVVKSFIEDPANAELAKAETRKILWRPSRQCLEQHNAVEVDGGAHAEFEVLCGSSQLLNATVATGGVSRRLLWHNIQFSGALVSVDILDGAIKTVGASGRIGELLKYRDVPDDAVQILGNLSSTARECAANNTLTVRGLVGGGWRQRFSESESSWDDGYSDEDDDKDDGETENEAVVGYAEAFDLSYKSDTTPTEAPSTENPKDVTPAPPGEEPTPPPTVVPAELPTGAPVNAPTDAPTVTSPPAPANVATPEPTSSAAPAEAPTGAPTAAPTEAPTDAPTEAPTDTPTEAPTAAPTEAPTAAPTEAPTAAPTEAPTAAPTDAPTVAPTEAPTDAPTDAPTATPTQAPTNAPTPAATKLPGDDDAAKGEDVAPADGGSSPVSQQVPKTDGPIGDLTASSLKKLSEDASTLYVQSGLQCRRHDVVDACFMNTAMSKIVHGKMSTVVLTMSHKEEEDLTPRGQISLPMVAVVVVVGVAAGAWYRTYSRRQGYQPIPAFV